MKEIMLTNTGNMTQVDDNDFMFLLNITANWRESPEGYAYCYKGYEKIYMHREIGKRMGFDIDKYTVDHEQRYELLNNQRYNLRQATQSEQNMNQGIRKDNTLGYKGIYKNGSGYGSRFWINGKQINLGTYRTREEAAVARTAAIKEYYVNFPSEEGNIL